MSRRRLGAAAVAVTAALSTAGLGPLPLPAAAAPVPARVAAPPGAAVTPQAAGQVTGGTASRATVTPRAGATSPDGEPRPPYPRSVGLPAAVALVALGGSTAALLRVLRSEPGRGSGYAGPARREHPPVTERP